MSASELSYSEKVMPKLAPQVHPSNHQTQSVIKNTNLYDIFQECHLNLALCLIRQTQFEDAIGCLTAVLYYNPKSI
jgi:regulator of sirC expression with transglutaminase-like and TPR domain